MATACAFDWSVRPALDGGGADGATDAVTDAAQDGNGNDAEPDAPAACDLLVAAASEARGKARICQLAAGHCATKVKDECDCDVFVAVDGSAATQDFGEKVARTKAAGCRAHCPATCPTLPVTGGCVQKPSTVFECTP
jgi:hypothetical protein